MNKIKFAIIGCGLIANTHAKAISDISEASLVGAWDIDSRKSKEFCQKYAIRQLGSLEELFNDKEINAVCICTPSVFHKEQAISALCADKHVILEKPMALCADDAMQICETAKEKNRLLTVISQNRFSEDIRYVKKLIEEKAFGQLCFCDLYMKYYRDNAYFSASNWRGRLATEGGGALMNQGIHGIDLMNYLVGEGRMISAKVKTLIHNIEVEDSAVAIMEYSCGALGVIEGSTCAFPGFRRKIEINGERGYVILSDSKIERLVIDEKTIIESNFDPHPNTAASPTLESHELHRLQIENFISAIQGKEALCVTPQDAYYSVKLIESIYKNSLDNN